MSLGQQYTVAPDNDLGVLEVAGELQSSGIAHRPNGARRSTPWLGAAARCVDGGGEGDLGWPERPSGTAISRNR
jgi:hypothetical protein